MANVNIPKQDGNSNPSSRGNGRSAQNKQAQYQQMLAYERAFLKKKEALEESSQVRQLQSEIQALQDAAKADLSIAQELISDKEQLEQELTRIKIQLAADLAAKQQELIREQRAAEYEAHKFAMECSMRAFQTQNVHQRAQTASVLADAQKVQTDKLRTINSIEIAELQSQKKAATSEEERRRIASQIKTLRKEIRDAEKEEAKYQQQAAEYAAIVKRVDFERLSAAEKLAAKQAELRSLQEEASQATAEINSEIEAKKMDKAAADSKGDSAKSAKLQSEIDALQAKMASSEATYASAIAAVSESIESPDGFRAQAAASGAQTSSAAYQVNMSDAAESSELAAHLVHITESLDDFVSAFEIYVDILDAKLTNESAMTSSSTSISSSTTGSTKGSNVADKLYELTGQTTAGGFELQNELSSKLDGMMSILSRILQKTADKASSDKDSSDEESDEDEKPKKKKPEPTTAQEILFKRKTAWQEARDPVYKQNAKEERKANLQWFTQLSDNGKWMAGLEMAGEAMKQASEAIAGALQAIDGNIANYFKDQAEINAKLQGTDLTYADALNTLTRNLSFSMITKQSEYITKFKELVDAGISHNIESRAFLATVSDKVINTFDVLDQNLQRLVRLQQADSTAARMGLESTLNEFLNRAFSDSSYLSQSGPHDTISGNILEASSMLSKEMSLEFEYAVHKWLGALHSLGMSQETLTKIAQGLNYLGTGNVTALSNDANLQTLMAMSAVHGSVPYTDILTQGLNAQNTNKLLSGMLTYLMQIANNTDSNQVVKSAYSSVFGIGMSDLRAISNLTQEDITSLSELTTTYSASVEETESQLGGILGRTHASIALQNLYDNAVLGAALGIGNNPVLYGLWKVLNLIEGLTGGIALPFVNVMGSGFDLNTTVTQLAKAGVAGLSLMGSLIGALGSGGITGGLTLDSWNYVEATSRGSVSQFKVSGADSGFSQSTRLDYTGSGNTDDIKRTEMSDASDGAQEDSEVTNKNVTEEQEVPKLIQEATEKIQQAVDNGETTLLKETILMSQAMASIKELLEPTRVFLTTGIGNSMLSPVTWNYDSASQLITLSDSTIESMSSTNSTLSTVNEIFGELVNGSTTGFNSDIWSILMANPNWSRSSSDLATAISSELDKVDNLEDASSHIVTKLYNTVNNKSLTTQEREAMIEKLNTVAQLQTLNQVVFPDYVVATVNELSPTVKKYLEELIKAAVDASVAGTTMFDAQLPDEGAIHPIVQQLVRAFGSGTTTPVSVTLADAGIAGITGSYSSAGGI